METFIVQWWAVALRGVLAIAAALSLGVLPMAKPQALFAWYAALQGVLNLMGSCWSNRDLHGAWVLILAGTVGIEAALLAILWPAIPMVALLSVVTTWAVVTGVLDILAGLETRHRFNGEWLFGVSGCASVVAGLLVQHLGLDSDILLLSIQACLVVGGISLITLGVQLRPVSSLHHYQTSGTSVVQDWLRHRRH